MEPMIGQIIMFAGNYAPRGWKFCQGQLLPISGNESLYSVIGTTYGGNGVTNFGLPDLRGRVPRGVGVGPGMNPVRRGNIGGKESRSLTKYNMPSHTHTFSYDETTAGNGGLKLKLAKDGDVVEEADVASHIGGKGNTAVAGGRTGTTQIFKNNATDFVELNCISSNASASASGFDKTKFKIDESGNAEPLSTLDPYLGMQYIIALEGEYPQRD